MRRSTAARASGLAAALLAPLVGFTQPFPSLVELASLYPGNGGDGSAGMVLGGSDSGDRLGPPRNIGDLNGDGLSDFAISSFRADNAGGTDAGEIYVVFGTADGFPATLPVRRLLPGLGGDGSQGFVLFGGDQDEAGGSVAAAGDLNGDGRDDLVVGARDADVIPGSSAGAAYVIYGRDGGFPALFPLNSLSPAAGGDGSEGFIINGILPTDDAGSAVASAGDFNHDGLDDLLITAVGAGVQASAGQAYIVYGRDSGFPARFSLARLLSAGGGDGSEGVVIRGNGLVLDLFGSSAASLGDVNADGVSDVYIGAVGTGTGGVGYMIFGAEGDLPPEISVAELGLRGRVVTIVGRTDQGQFGAGVGAGDVNGDGIDDVLVSDPIALGDTFDLDGQAYVIYGRDDAFPETFRVSDLDPDNGATGEDGALIAGTFFSIAGVAIGAAGDVNGDGVDDILIGASQASPALFDQGEAYVVYGVAGGLPAEVRLADLLPEEGGDGSEGIVIRGAGESDQAGSGVAAGDFNGDGQVDLLVTAPLADPLGAEDAGEAYLILGDPSR